jgi:septum formation protein
LLLCSTSPRRRDLLSMVGLRFEVIAPHIDESRRSGESPEQLAERLAREKAAAGLAAFGKRAVPLAADTVVAVGDQDLAKPRDRADAARMLRTLSGQTHRVITGVCVAERSLFVSTDVRFATLTAAQIEWLAASGDGDDKAGAYAVQGLAGAFIDRIEGSFTNVVGLPMAETLRLLADAGVELPWSER